MVIANLLGGLGNQMFQYACGRALSLRTGQPFRVTTDLYGRGYTLHNGFELDRVFTLDVKHAAKPELRGLLGWQSPQLLRRVLGRPSMRWATDWANEPGFRYWSGIDDIHGPTYLHGYWQSERYFADHADIIREDFTFRKPHDVIDIDIRDRMRAKPSASLHVRRGDYIRGKNRAVYALCGVEYYREAICAMRQRVPGVHLFAFSDDPDWVEEHLGPFGPIEVIRHNKGGRSARDLWLMSQADHNIIANSSFSWWGAWLNASAEKIVLAPRRWFVNGTDESDLIPSTWMRI